MMRAARDGDATVPTIWQMFSAAAVAVPDRTAIVWGDERPTYGEIHQQALRFAGWLRGQGLGRYRERSEIGPFESGQDHVAILMRNRPEYVSAVFGVFGAAAVPVNVNYRYVANELVEILAGSATRALVYEAHFAEQVAEIRDRLPALQILIEAGGNGTPLIDGAIPFEAILGDPAWEKSFIDNTDPDDLCIIYTGGTTGAPKAVLWSQSELCLSMTSGVNPATGRRIESLHDLAKNIEGNNYRLVVLPPIMHLAGLSMLLTLLPSGSTLLFPAGASFDARTAWELAEREQAHVLLSIGNATGKPLLDELRRHKYDLTSLRGMVNGAAPISDEVRDGLLVELGEGRYIFDSIGSSESGKQAQVVHRAGAPKKAATGERGGNRFAALPQTRVISADMTRVLQPEDREVGWLGSTGHLPFGYLGDPEKTARTFPVIDGFRLAVPGDRARYDEDGQIEVLGRDSVTINSGGEKIFAEEVEAAILSHPEVMDAIVVGRPSERWGAEVVAIVSTRSSTSVSSIQSACDGQLARYKWPKDVIFVQTVLRGPNGKADYRWASSVVSGEIVA